MSTWLGSSRMCLSNLHSFVSRGHWKNIAWSHAIDDRSMTLNLSDLSILGTRLSSADTFYLYLSRFKRVYFGTAPLPCLMETLAIWSLSSSFCYRLNLWMKSYGVTSSNDTSWQYFHIIIYSGCNSSFLSPWNNSYGVVWPCKGNFFGGPFTWYSSFRM